MPVIAPPQRSVLARPGCVRCFSFESGNVWTVDEQSPASIVGSLGTVLDMLRRRMDRNSGSLGRPILRYSLRARSAFQISPECEDAVAVDYGQNKGVPGNVGIKMARQKLDHCHP